MPIIEKRYIYLINKGLTCQDIIKNIEVCLRKNKLNSTLYKKNLNELRKSKEDQLSINGIIEIRESRKNNELSNLLRNGKFFTILSRPCIESGIIFSGNVKNAQINILPFKENNSQLRKNSNITKFKESFGKKK